MLTIKQVRKLVVLVVGGTVLLFGILLIVLPGPSSLVIPAGLAILATEFVWAQRLLAKVKKAMADAASLVTRKKGPGGQ
jgi:tellurite resistance protein TerC